MPVVRLYPIGEASPQPIPNAQPNVAAASDINLFGGNQARDLQQAGQNLGQASDSLFALYERKAKDANDNGVQDGNNQYLNGEREILRTGPDAYYKQTGAEAINGAAAVTAKLTKFKDQILSQAPNDYQRQKLGPILDAHLAVSTDGIVRYAGEQQRVYGRTVAATAIETSRADAAANPANLPNAMARAEDATRFLYQGRAPEVVESEVRNAGGSVVSAAIGSLITRNDPAGVRLYQQYRDRLDPGARRVLGAAAGMLSNSLDAEAWLRDRSATLAADRTKAQAPQGAAPAPTGDAALDAVNAASASASEPPPITSSGGLLLPQDGVAGYGQRLAEIEDRRRALTALNEREFAGNPARLRANRAAIETDSARGRAAAKAEADGLYADLRRYLTTGGPGGGRAVAPPPAMLLSRFTDAQQASIARQVDRAIAGQPPATDPQTGYAIHQALTGDDAAERQRWASTNLVQFMDRLSDEDYASLAKLQTAVRTNDGGAETTRLQIINRMANQALRTAGIDPTPRLDAAPDSDAAQAARFHRALQDELSAFESSKGRKATAAEAYDIVSGLKDTGIKSGWLKVNDRLASPTVASDIPLVDDAFHQPGAELAQAVPEAQPTEYEFRPTIGLPKDFETFHRLMEEERQREATERAAAGTGGAPGAPAMDLDPGTLEYRDADAQARAIVAQQDAERTGGQGGVHSTEPPSDSPERLAVEAETRRVVVRQDAERRHTDRMITAWLASKPNDGSPPQVPPELAARLSADKKEAIEAFAALSDNRVTDPQTYKRIRANLLNYNSQVRLKWAREPLFEHRIYLSPEDFAELAHLQNRLNPHTGQVIGSAPVPDDLVSLYDWLAPDPDWDYGTFIASDDYGHVRPALPAVSSFFKGMLDLFAAQKTGELTTDALESFMTLHSGAGSMFGPLGGEGTLVAGGKRITARVPKTAEQQAEEYQRKVKQMKTNSSNGLAFEREKAALRNLEGLDVGEQVTLETASGKRHRVDLLLRDRTTGEISLESLKSSPTAPFSKEHRAFHEDVAKRGATVMGAGKPKFEGGLEIPASPYKVTRKLKFDE